MIPVEYLRIFTPDQFSLLLSGIPKIDVDDWEQNTEVSYNNLHLISLSMYLKSMIIDLLVHKLWIIKQEHC